MPIISGGTETKMAFFSKIKESLSKTKNSINEKLETVINTFKSVDESCLKNLKRF